MICVEKASGGVRPTGRRPWMTLAVSLVIPAWGCGGEAGADPSEGPEPVPPVVRDSAGVLIVENSEPQWPLGTEWRVGELLSTIGTTQGEPPYELYRVLDATRLSDGTVAVGNSSTGEIRFFGEDGGFIRSVGSRGEGPGEFRGANALRALRRVEGDTLVAWDIYGQTVSLFSPDGGFVRSFQLKGPAQQHFFAGIFADRSLLMRVSEHGPSNPGEIVEGLFRRDFTLHHYGRDHSLLNSFWGIEGSDQYRGRFGPYGVVSGDAPFGRVTSFSARGSRVFMATGDSHEISVHGQAGSLEMLIRRTMEPIPVTPEMIAKDRDRREREEQAHLEESNVEPRVMRMIAELPYPEVLPPYGTTLADSEGNLWVEEFRMSAEEPCEWSVFDADGVWLGRLTLPDGLEVFEIGSDYILGKRIDELEVEHVDLYELVKE